MDKSKAKVLCHLREHLQKALEELTTGVDYVSNEKMDFSTENTIEYYITMALKTTSELLEGK